MNSLNGEMIAISKRLLDEKTERERCNTRAKNRQFLLDKNKETQEQIELRSKEKFKFHDDLQRLTDDLEKMKQPLLEIEAELKELSEVKSTLVSASKELDRLDKLYVGELCPTCGQSTLDIAEKNYVNYIQENLGGILNDSLETLLECKGDLIDKSALYDKRLKELQVEYKEAKELKEKTNTEILKNTIKQDSLDDTIQKLKDSITPDSLVDPVPDEKEILEIDNRIKLLEAEKQSIQDLVEGFSNIKISEIRENLDSLEKVIISYEIAIKSNGEIKQRNANRKNIIAIIQKEIDDLTQQNFESIKQKDTLDECYRIFDKDLPNFMSIKACAAQIPLRF